MVKFILELSYDNAQRVLDLLVGRDKTRAETPELTASEVAARIAEVKPVAESPTKKRGRPPKVEPVQAVAAAEEAIVAPVVEAAVVAAAKAEPVAEITGDMVRAALVKYSGSGHGIIGVRKLLQPLGYEKISEIQPKDYAKVIEATKA